jgi:hypothetical protein
MKMAGRMWFDVVCDAVYQLIDLPYLYDSTNVLFCALQNCKISDENQNKLPIQTKNGKFCSSWPPSPVLWLKTRLSKG